jgi:hypothetical protein
LPRIFVHRTSRTRALLVSGGGALLLAACGAGDNDSNPGGVTVGEARALAEAAEMLDERRLPDEAPPAASQTGATSRDEANAGRAR